MEEGKTFADDDIVIFPWRIKFGVLEHANREAMKRAIPVCQYMEEILQKGQPKPGKEITDEQHI